MNHSEPRSLGPGAGKKSPKARPLELDDQASSSHLQPPDANTYVFPIRSVFHREQSGTREPSVSSSVSGSASGRGATRRSSQSMVMDMLENPHRQTLLSPQHATTATATFSRRFSPASTPASTPGVPSTPTSSSPPSRDAPTESSLGSSPPVPAPQRTVRIDHNPVSIPDHHRTQLEPDEEGVTSLVNDFSGIVRLGDTSAGTLGNGSSHRDGSSTLAPGSRFNSTVRAESPKTAVTGQPLRQAAAPAPTSTNRQQTEQARPRTMSANGMGSAKMRAQTHDSVRDFVNEQANIKNVADPNVASSSPAPDTIQSGYGGRSSQSSLETSSYDSSSGSDAPSNMMAPHPGTAASRQQPNWVGQEDDSSAEELPHRNSNDFPSLVGSEGGQLAEEPNTTDRFQYLQTEDGHHVVVGREGQLKRCEDEPIAIPGAVQGFGVLVLLEDNLEAGTLTVRQVSENSTELLGLSAAYLFRLDCFTKILTADQEDILRDNIETLAYPDETDPDFAEYEGPQVFRLSGFGEPGSADSWDEGRSVGPLPNSQRRREWTCWVAASRPHMQNWVERDEKGNEVPSPELIILEFELERDNYNPLSQQLYQPENPASPDYASLAGETEPSPASLASGQAQKSPLGRLNLGSSENGCTSTMERDGRGGGTSGTGSGQSRDRGSSQFNSGTNGTTAPFGSTGLMPSGSTQPTSIQEHPPTASISSKSTGSQPMGLDGVEYEPPLESILESTTNHAKPLRALQGMRRGGGSDQASLARSNDEASSRGSISSRSSRRRRPNRRQRPQASDTLDIFAVLNQINEQLGNARNLESFLKITVGIIKDLTRFHRVLIYKFDEDFNGEVVSELVDWGQTTDLYKGLKFPAADIPPQARELYKINKVRFLYDRSQMTARLVLRYKGDLNRPLDMTHCFLRAMSPIHIKYLANMQVRSSMSVSIIAFGKLWGLIACHSYGHHGMRVPFPIRQMLRILSDLISRNIERLSYARRLHTRQLVHTHGLTGLAGLDKKPAADGNSSSGTSSSGYIVSNADELLGLFDADSGLLVINDGCKLLGQCDQAHTMLAIAEYLRIAKFDKIVSSNHIAKDFPDLVLSRAADTIAGLLYIPLTAQAGQDFIVFLRKGEVHEVKWAGKPYKDENSGAQSALDPRKSFKMWKELVVGRSRVWSEDQLESANVLAPIYGKFIQVWRERQNTMVSNQLTAILLSNTSHAVRTPLSQIINTLELALAGDIDSDTRSMLENSHQASRALLFHVHDLLDLTRIETGNVTTFHDPFDLKQTITQTVRLYQNETTRRGIEFKIHMSDDLPPVVVGDSRKIKTVVSNLVANAVKYTQEGTIDVTCHIAPGVQHSPGWVPIEIKVSDTGCGIAPEKLESMFVILEGAEDRPETGQIGLGLAVVARIVEQCAGQLRAESKVGKGTTFYFTVNMELQGSGSEGTYTAQAFSDETTTRKSSPAPAPRNRSVKSLELGKSPERSGRTYAPSAGMSSSTSNDKAAVPQAITDGVLRADDIIEPPSPDVIEHSPHFEVAHLDEETAPRVKLGPKGEPKFRILIVEDDMVNSQILQRRLKMDKHTVLAVENGQEAVDLLRSDWDIDAVIMDIQMPIMDGYESAREIRKMEKAGLSASKDIQPMRLRGRVPIFALSASLQEGDCVNLVENFDGWLLKPLNFKRMRALLDALLDVEKRKVELYSPGTWLERGGYFHV